MSNLEKYNKTFVEIFNVDVSLLNDTFDAETVIQWDSVSQLSLVTALEDEFDIMLDSEDILDFKSYALGKGILSKYGVNF